MILEGKAALVTGGAGGIGGASARWLARDGCAVTVMGRTEAALQRTVAELGEVTPPGVVVGYVVGDATVSDDVERALDVACGPTGGLDICVQTVGGGTMVPLLAMDEEVFLGDLRRNLLPAFLAIKLGGARIAAAGGGSIVCISSDSARMSWPFLAGYCAGKGGLEQLVRVAADELGRCGVRVNAVRPGLVRTDSSGRMFEDDEIIGRFVEQKPLGRTGVPDDIAAGVRYLAGPESSWVTGQSLAIEGGNELRRAPYLEAIVRRRHGDAVVDACLAGRLPDPPSTLP